MRTILRRARERRWLIPLIISAILLPIITGLATTWLQQYLGGTNQAILQAIGYLALVAIILGIAGVALGKEKTIDKTTREMRPGVYDGLVVIVGTGRKDTTPEELSHSPAIEYHLNQKGKGLVCWLIATDGSVHAAESVRERYESQCRGIEIHVLKDAFDVQEAYIATEAIYAQGRDKYELEPTKIISDYTGGTKPISAGMLLACRDRWPLQYMFGRPGEIKTAPILVKFRT